MFREFCLEFDIDGVDGGCRAFDRWQHFAEEDVESKDEDAAAEQVGAEGLKSPTALFPSLGAFLLFWKKYIKCWSVTVIV